MESLEPRTSQELARMLAAAAGDGKSITVGGAFTKRRMAPAVTAPDMTVSTAGLARVLRYEPSDLTISVEAGVPFSKINQVVGEHRLMVPLDPPFNEDATVGGVVAANVSGPRRRLYGTARERVIGMEFATLEGKLIQTGGMVVKNAAGLDMAKLMVGSFGTLAAIAVVNFKLVPQPASTRSFIAGFRTAAEVFGARDALLASVLQPSAVDVLNPRAAERIGRQDFLLLVQAGGNHAALDRYSRQLEGAEAVEGTEEAALWESVREFTPRFLDEHAEGAVVRVSSTLAELSSVMEEMNTAAVARAGSGICHGYFAGWESAADWVEEAADRHRQALLEFVPEHGCHGRQRWPAPGSDFAVMERIKQMFDPKRLLNRGCLYGRL